MLYVVKEQGKEKNYQHFKNILDNFLFSKTFFGNMKLQSEKLKMIFRNALHTLVYS